ncbi:MAG: histidinol-phosphate transaminase [Gammaproteobacteria bacterium]|nr:histidinol-phosphate transaminase [Gammaproteobacteria bacterium]
MSIENRVKHWIRSDIRAMHAYHVPDPSGYIKLDAMENPYTWPAEMVEEWTQLLRDVSMNRYPDPHALQLKSRLREAMQIPEGQDLILGNGSDELIQMIAFAMRSPGRAIMAPAPSFIMYQMIATFAGMDYEAVPLREDFSLDMPAMLARIQEYQPAVIFLAYPNNPTGNLFKESEVVEILQAADGLVVVDEAYHAFAGSSFMDRLGQYENLLVMRTVSKMGLAGLRLGLLAGPHPWLAEFDKVRLPYNINVLTQASADFALKHRDVLDRQTAELVEHRSWLMQALKNLDGIIPYPSDANFILFKTATGKADLIFEGLKERKVLIKNLHKAGGLLTDSLRVTVGSREENSAFIDALIQTLAWTMHQ